MTRKDSGFTIIEALIVLALMGVLLALGLPFLKNVIQRSTLESTARQTATLMQRARMEAIQLNQEALVLFDAANSRAVAFVDEGPQARVFDSDDRVLGQVGIPAQVLLEGPGSSDGVTFALVEGPIFQGNGSVVEEGAMRFADQRGNFLQVEISPRATGRVEIRKWRGSAWYLPGEGGPWEWY